MTTEREGLLDKVRGLLSKTVTNGCTEAEALTALSKARAMMDAYCVTEGELNLTKDEKAILRREPPGTKDPHRIKQFLQPSVAQFCNCQGWHQHRDKGGGLVFCGLQSDAQFATWLLDALTAFVQAELVKHLMEADYADKQESREGIRGFVLGCTDRISQRLNDLCKQSAAVATSNTKALAVIKGQAVQAKLDELGLKFRSCSSSCSTWDVSSYAAGKAAGDRASFGRPVSGRNATLRLK
jgi:Protein of unknown function (DUF2786)